MFNLPKSTTLNKRISKNKFYEKLKVNAKLEKQFVSEIDSVYWTHKLSADTMNISSGKNVQEIEIITVHLKLQGISMNVIEAIDRGIPYHVLFLMRYKDLVQAWISFKESSKSKADKFRVEHYFYSDWVNQDELKLEFKALDLDQLYQNLIQQVAGSELTIETASDLKEAVTFVQEKEKLQKQIKRLENKVASEKQFNRQVELMSELRKLKNQLETC